MNFLFVFQDINKASTCEKTRPGTAQRYARFRPCLLLALNVQKFKLLILATSINILCSCLPKI